MKAVLTTFIVLVTFVANAQSTWKVDTGHSSINFAVSHLVISETTGSFDTFDITAVTGEDFSNPTFEVSIQTASINTKNDRRDNHLRADDFFDAEKHPMIVFKSASVEKTGEKTFLIKGDITIKGVTKKVNFNGKLNGILKNDRGEKAGLKLTTIIKRTDFGVGNSGGSVGEDVEVTINLEMKKQ
ncbi:MAG: YceI family protein [Polaribacter sp.]|uniref:YceI family protein n=1 Tax=Algibacter sp. TaxID=1872428 RepID=UPI0026031292|nr:YceI family protein [Algibacter sp.]MDG1730951.1 YceI family protein [Algibacter sp.]MDG2356738.1 YceI family protein [Polaribacter sp.]